MNRKLVLFIGLILACSAAWASGPSSAVEVLCHARSSPFKPSDAPRLPDDQVLRTLLTTEEPALIQQSLLNVDLSAYRGTTKTTPLALAASVGNLKAVQILLRIGAGIDFPTASGATALEAAILNGQAGSACLLLRQGARLPQPGSRPYLLPSAALSEDFQGATALVEFLAAEGYDVNARMNGDTALHIAAGLGNTALVRVLLRRGADVHARSGRAETPEMVANRSGNDEVAQLLGKAR